MTVFDDIGFAFNELARQIQISGIFSVIGQIIGIVLIIAIFVAIIFFVTRTWRKNMGYVGATDRLGTYKIGVRNDYYIIGNVNKNKSFLIPEVFERMKRVPEYPEIKDGVAVLQNMWSKGILYAYDMRVSESFYEDKYDLPSDDIILLSPIAIDNPIISWQDTRGERSWTGDSMNPFKKYPRNIFCSEYTSHIDVKDKDGYQKRVYVLAPYTEAMNEQMTSHPDEIKIVKDVMRGKQAFINVIQLPQHEALAKIAAVMGGLSDVFKDLEVKTEELKSVKEQRDKLNKLCDGQKMEIEGYKGLLKTHPLLGEDRPIVPLEPKSVLFAIAIACVAGFAAKYISLNDYFIRSQGIDFIFLMVFMFILIAGFKMFEKSQEKEEKFGYEKPGSRR